MTNFQWVSSGRCMPPPPSWGRPHRGDRGHRFSLAQQASAQVKGTLISSVSHLGSLSLSFLICKMGPQQLLPGGRSSTQSPVLRSPSLPPLVLSLRGLC